VPFCLTSAQANPDTLFLGDEHELQAEFNKSVASHIVRSAEVCLPRVRTAEAAFLMDSLSLDRHLLVVGDERANKLRAYVIMLDRQGYAVCPDPRLPEINAAFSIDLHNKVIALNPNAPEPYSRQLQLYQSLFGWEQLAASQHRNTGLSSNEQSKFITGFPKDYTSLAPIPFTQGPLIQPFPTRPNLRHIMVPPRRGAVVPWDLQVMLNSYRI